LQWSVPWTAGTLRVAAVDNGNVVASKEVRTAGEPARITLTADRPQIRGDGRDLSFVTVRVEDANGNLSPLADNLVQFAIEGPGRIVGLDNGNAATVEPFQGDRRRAFHGLAAVIVRADKGRPGTIRLAATSAGLRPAEISIGVRQPVTAAAIGRAEALPRN
jgi:beta-galactosidase